MTALMLLDLHQQWSWFVIIANGSAGLWALGAHRFPVMRSRALWWYTLVAQLTMFVQVGLGVALVNREKLEFPQFHAFYGFVGIMAIAIIFSYRNQMKHRLYLLYGFGGLFVMGLGIRALLVGR
ncbi:MAG: hypothetical protein O3C62_03855 [Actinomycetota bacterium]|nr:hypothetical protein [Actinomycetota bacterium]MDA2971015.1 hypothetical protein [Actinomycetota bacterium]MDA3000799.1 hypothetical protein [Actinomycetota bacterium]